MLQSAREHYRRQQRITALGLIAARRARSDVFRLVATVTLYQRAAAADAALAVEQMLAEQDIAAEPEGRVQPRAFAGVASDGRPLRSLLEQAGTDIAFDLIVATQLQDAARVSAGVAITARPAVKGYVRMLNPPSCPRCAILAGQWYGWNEGFKRHPRCDCRHVPAQEAVPDLTTDPQKAFKAGQIRGLTQAETKALNAGADIGRVINARRGMYVDDAGRRLTRELSTRMRGPRPTPEQIYRTAGDDRDAAISSLQRFGYLI